jgi:hypothetical protein
MRRIHLLAAVSLFAVCGRAHGQGGLTRPLFEDATALELTIEAPFRELERNVDDREELHAIVRYRPPAGPEIVLDAEIRVRGKSRLAICDFPPLRIDFDSDALESTVFAGQDHLKLVTLCKRRDSYRVYLAQEYRIYEAYNALTDYSFRVRWASVEYVDTGGRPKPFTEPAFFIEEDRQVAERNGLEALDVSEVPLSELDARQTALLALFQYMIANTDWSATTAAPDEDDCCHNGKPIGRPGGDVIVLPYDFDFSGLIQTDYAKPRSYLPIRSVRERLYRGYCAMNDELPWAVERFNEKRGAIERIFDAEPVDEHTRRRTIKYLDDFYATINDPEELGKEVVGDCRSAD